MNARRPPSVRRRPAWLGVLAVAVFILRALIPAGYMYAPVDGHVRLVMCPAGIQHSNGMKDMPGMSHGDAAGPMAGMHAGAHAALNSEHCPFAFSGGAGLLGRVVEPSQPYFSLLQPARAPVVDSVPASPPPRFHAPRGPPSLA